MGFVITIFGLALAAQLVNFYNIYTNDEYLDYDDDIDYD